MKVNHLILTFAAAATLAACSSEMDTPTLADDTKTVTFTAQLPGGMGRSYGDGTTAKNLTYAVYDSDKKLLTNLTGTTTFDGLTANVSLTLINGKEYNIVFWASAAEGSPYSFDPETATVTADYTNTLCNDERLDAFTTTYNVTPGDTDTDVSVTLKRPFAQLNIGTNDLADAKSAGLGDDATISVTVEDVCTTLNLLSGETGGAQDVTFGYGALPSGETFPVSGYDYLAMNYLMVGSDSSTHNVSFQVSGISATNEYTAVPLKANYRTNLYGSLLTTKSTFDVDIEIDPTFETPIITYKDKFFDNLADAIIYVYKNAPKGTAEENRILIWSGTLSLRQTDLLDYPVNVTFEGMGDNHLLTISSGQIWKKNIVFKNLNIKSSVFRATAHGYTGTAYPQNISCEFIGCTITGQLGLGNEKTVSFKDCDFYKGSGWYCLDAAMVDIQNCNFDYYIRLNFLYGTATIEHCNFTAVTDYNYAAINITTTNTKAASAAIYINDCNASGFTKGLWSNWYGNKDVTVIVDGVEQ